MRDKMSMSVSKLYDLARKREPEHECSYDGYERVSYQKLWESSLSLAASIRELDIQKGDKIAVCLPNWNEFIVIAMAAAHLGAVLVPFNTRYRQDEVAYILGNSGAKIAFFTEEFDGISHGTQFVSAKEQLQSLERLISVRSQIDGMLSYEQLLEKNKHTYFTSASIDPDNDAFIILYTSGSTGTPKGAVLTHSNVVNMAVINAEELNCTAEDVFFLAVPVFHVFGFVPGILSTIASGARMVLMEKYKRKAALELIESEKVTVKYGVPTMFILELSYKDFTKYDLSSLRTGIIAAAPCPVEIVKKIRYEMGCDIMIAYGLSETSPCLTMTRFDDSDIIRAETVGRPLPGVELKIVNENREEVGTGEVGEVACRSLGLMKGYYKMPEKTAEVIDENGWFYTGDMGTIDEEGHLRMIGRKKEMIIRGGFNIYPKEVEEVLYTHPDVMEVAIVGLPDTVLGEVSCACVKLKAGATIEAGALIKFVKEQVADYKVPDKLLIVDRFPMTASGKIMKIALQNKLKESLKGELR